MNIAIVGTGYVGLVSGTCFAELGATVYCVDINENKIKNLQNGIIPIYEPGLEELVLKNTRAKRLIFTTDLKSIVNNVDVVFSAVGTPPKEDGSADLQYVLDVAKMIGMYMEKYLVVVTKSTVPVGTSEKVKSIIKNELDKRNLKLNFDVASNPEFLKEGAAIKDFMQPDRVVIGVDSLKAKDVLTSLYKPMMLNNFRVIFMDIISAEMTKYAANAMLATRISFMNDIANLCEIVGANINEVRLGIGSDMRIGSKFLYPGCGYGGSCFPKDVKALIKTGEENGYSMSVLNAVEYVNGNQKNILFEKFKKYFNNDIKGKTVAVWGLSFKPETNDMREAPSLVLIEQLLVAECIVVVYDPVAMEEAKLYLDERVNYVDNMYDAVVDANVIFHVTEWKEFRMPSWKIIKKAMQKNPLLIDGRNVYSDIDLEGISYINIGNAK